MANSAFSDATHAANRHSDIAITSVASNDILKFDGTITSLTVDNLTINGNTITSTDSNGSITLTPAGSGSVVISKVDINSGDITGVTISGGLTWSAAQNLNSQALTNVNIDSGNISAATISGGLTWSANQDLNDVNLTNVDIDSGAIDGTAIGANSASTVVATQVDITAAGDLRLQDTTGGQHVALEAAGTTTTHTLTLPAAQGGASTVLTNNGSGALTWAAAAAGGDLSFGGDTFGADKVIGSNDNYALAFETNNGTRMTILNSGYVGIGTTNPTQQLEITNETKFGTGIYGSDKLRMSWDTGYASIYGLAGIELRIGANNTNNHLKISTAGAVTMPSQPSFIAKLTTSQDNVTGNTILFRSDNAANNQWNIMENRGSGFANGKFTAPVAGLYHFSLIINLEGLTSSNGYYNLIMYTDTAATNISITSSNPWAQCYTPSGNLLTRWSLLVEMDANDYAYFGGYVYGGSQVVDLRPSTFFTGYLVA